jgi:spermidine synthase
MLVPSLKPLFDWVQKVTLPKCASSIFVLFCLALLIGKRWSRISLPMALATTGFAGMVIELTLIFGFQVVYGYVFYEIALLITAFMAGIAAGSLLVTRSRQARPVMFLFLSTEAGLALFSLFLIALFSSLGSSLLSKPLVLHLLFLLLLFASGIFIGMEFPLATSIYQSGSPIERRVGALYAADLTGGCVGGLLTGFLLFPLLGLFSTLFLVAILKLCSFTFLLVQQKRGILM